MESDSALAAIALALSLVFFAAASLGGASIRLATRERRDDWPAEGVGALQGLYELPVGPTGSLDVLAKVSLPASLVSAVALVIAQVGVRWVAVALASLAVLLLLTLVHSVAEMMASAYGERIAIKTAVSVRAVAWLMNPFLTVQAALIRRWASRQAEGADQEGQLVRTQISLPLGSAEERLDEREVRMIRAVVRQDKTIAREIMVPRVDMVAAEIGMSVADLADQMVNGPHSRLPVYRGDLDHIEGIAYARDILRYLVEDEGRSTMPLEGMIRTPLFIPESKTLEELLAEFQERRVHMAIVIDEYGGVSGLVTIEDLLEEIVGEIQDEFDAAELEVQRLSESEFLMDARVTIEQLNELLSISVEGDGFDTLGGFVYERLGKIPSAGDTVEHNGLRIEVISTAGRRLKRLRVSKTGLGGE